MGLSMLRDWCRWMGVNAQRCLLIMGIPDDCEEDKFREILQAALRPLGRYRVLCRVFRKELGARVTLVEFAEYLNRSLIPQQIPGNGEPWSVIFLPQVPDSEFQECRNLPAQPQGEEMGESMGAAGEAGPPGEGAWDAAAVTHLRAGAQQWAQALQPILENMAYQELRAFSGIAEPDPEEEESFESWLNHANDMLYLWRHISERERRRRLVECLEGPALDVIFELLEEHPDTPAQDCLAALVQVFGNKNIQVTARLKFLICSQGPQETLLAYVERLEGLLQAAVEKGAIHPATTDQMRARQVLMRARPNWTLQNKLRRMRLERRPPGYLALLQLVRETEAWEAALVGKEQLGGEAAEAGPSHREAAGPAPAVEDASQASSVQEEASGEAAPDPECAAEAASDADDATKAATQEDEEAFGPAGQGQAGPSDAPGAPTAPICSVSGAGPEGPGYGPESLAQARRAGG
ncbi:hypothetical protein H920_05835 [Fukomys damarensis]|uniref:Paraneoplastic antigen Ma6F n=1 Tax=Fukomys damarensis TaxID=885580 RepID=A0A091EBU5_FUKDA|nr:hypothetical protein H920_05835 [Fukomys damarensis]